MDSQSGCRAHVRAIGLSGWLPLPVAGYNRACRCVNNIGQTCNYRACATIASIRNPMLSANMDANGQSLQLGSTHDLCNCLDWSCHRSCLTSSKPVWIHETEFFLIAGLSPYGAKRANGQYPDSLIAQSSLSARRSILSGYRGPPLNPDSQIA